MYYKPVNINLTIFCACRERVKFVRHVMYANALRAANTTNLSINFVSKKKKKEKEENFSQRAQFHFSLLQLDFLLFFFSLPLIKRVIKLL